jgi:mannose/fructose/N-acetylgalactosamine-specific phosphotransferase system component IIC
MAAPALVLAALTSGLLAVERRAFLQAMASRPIVAGALIGLCYSRPIEGLSLGALLELFFLGGVSMGAALPDNELFAVAAAASCACSLSATAKVPTPSALAFAALVGLPAARLGRLADRVADRVNARAAARAQQEGPIPERLRGNLQGLWVPFAATAAVALGGALVGHLLSPALAAAPASLARGLALTWGALLMVAAAQALRSIRTLRAGLYAGASAALAAGLQAWRIFAS